MSIFIPSNIEKGEYVTYKYADSNLVTKYELNTFPKTGATGPTGPTGVQGLQGNTGPTGVQGLQGNTGVTGPTGVQGIQGPTGAFGYIGAQGQVVFCNTGPTGIASSFGLSFDINTNTTILQKDLSNLDIYDNKPINSQLKIYDSNSTVNRTNIAHVYQPGVLAGGCIQSSEYYPTSNTETPQSLFLQPRGGNLLLCSPNGAIGNVGIKTTNPLYDLDINGSINGSSLNITNNVNVGSLNTNGLFVPINKTTANYTLDVNGQINSDSYILAQNLGIGAVDPPQYPIHVNASTTASGNQYYSLSTIGQTNGNNWSSLPISIKASHWVWSNLGFLASSDQRIKTNIEDVNEDELNKFMMIKSKTYNYLDKIQNGNKISCGFIAQEVKEIYPQCVSIQREFIPNIFQVSERRGNSFITTKTVEKENKLKIIGKDNREHIITVEDIIEGGFTFTSEDELQDESYFIYGKEVDDFLTVDKTHIYTLNVAITQKLKTELDSLKEENKQLKDELKQIKEHLKL